MKVELIYDLDCPNVEEARVRLLEAFVQSGHPPRWQEWDCCAAESPSYVKGYGSPTILVDGVDVAGEPFREDVSCCRLYRDEGGELGGVPSVASIVQHLSQGDSAAKALGGGGWKKGWLGVPGIVVACLPNLACPACWPAYAGLLSAMGLGFLFKGAYLLPLTVVFLIVAVGVLAVGARRRRGYMPFGVGVVAALLVLIGKFLWPWDFVMYSGIVLLVGASWWNAWPVRSSGSSTDPSACGCGVKPTG